MSSQALPHASPKACSGITDESRRASDVPHGRTIPSAAHGFTLIETIVVLILIGVLSAVAVARVTDTDADVRAAENTLKVHLRHAQARAMNSETPWGVQATGGSYSLFQIDDDGTAVTVNFPGEEVSISFPGGISNFTVSFDGWGRPYDVQNPSGNTPITSAININGITITPETGFIP
jgi:prepilin-type N-terminal cleavage/methylation domain-containing protein